VGDRDAKLKIGVDASEMGPAAEQTKKLRTEIERIGTAGEGAAGDLNKAAAALDKVEGAEVQTVEASRAAAGALEGVGAAALDASQDAATGASGAAGALEGVTAAAGQEAAALEAAGAAAVESGAEARAALDRVTAAEQEAAAQAERLAEETRAAAQAADGFREGVQQIEQMAVALRESDLALEVQRQGLVSVIAETERLVQAEIATGSEGKANANLAGQALIGLKAKLADVNSEIADEIAQLRAAGVQGTSTFAEIKSSTLDIDTAIRLSLQQLNAGIEQLTDNAKITPRQIGFIGQAIETVKIAMVEAGQKNIAVTVEQLAMLEKLENEYTSLTAKANALTNAAADNRVRLKETGAQITGLTSGIAQLGSVLGPTGAKIGFVIGNVGQLGSVMENLKDSVKGLDLNTLSAGASAVKMGGQFAAVALVFAAATAAGVKLADMNSQNAETTHKLWQEIKLLASGEIDKAKGQIGGLQSALQSLLIAEDADDFGHAIAEVAIASGRGADGVKLYNVALRDGLPAQQAMRLAAGASAEVLKFYEASVRGGAAGHELWARALRESRGDAQAMAAIIARDNDQMQRSVAITNEQTEAQKANNAAAREANLIALMKADTQEHVLNASEQATDALTAQMKANTALEQAVNGTTASINTGLSMIRQMVTASDANSVALAQTASTLESVTAHVDGLSAAELARIQEVIELAKRGDELTASERAYAAALADSIINGDKAVTSMAARKAITAELKVTIDDLVSAVQAEATATGAGETAIQKAVKAAETLLASTKPLDAAERSRLSTIVELGKQVDELATQQDRLTAATDKGTAAQSDAGAVEAELYIVKSGKIDTLQQEIDLRAELIASLGSEKAGTDALSSSTQAIIEVQKDGHTVYSNLTSDQTKATEAMKAGGDAAERAGGQFGDILVRRLADGRVQITNVADAAREAATKIETIGTSSASAGPQVSEAMQKIEEASRLIDPAVERLTILDKLIDSLGGKLVTVADQFDRMTRSIDAAGQSATKASGYASGKVQETG
jgi:hypothetical protein